jgi:hypothetical protein
MELQLEEHIQVINKKFKELGLCEIALVSPADCLAQAKNARYFTPEMFQQLVGNVKKDGRLESTPLVYREGEKYRIISGHHRIDSAKEAGLEKILVMITEPQSQDEIVSKLLAHNAIVGKDDQTILDELFQSIGDIQLKLATGLQDVIGKVQYQSLNFKVGTWKELTFLFLPEDINLVDEALEEIVKDIQLKSSQAVRLVPEAAFDKFSATLRKIKKVENIKSNGTAVLRMAELAMEKLNDSRTEK